MSESVTYHWHCERCDEPFTVVFQPHNGLVSFEPPREQWLVCPHGCGHAERYDLQGRILKVWPGHSSEPPEVLGECRF
jgi:hypothetical protein